MKRVQFICKALALVLCICFNASAQQVFKTTTPSVIGYLEYLPDGYANNSDKYPMVIFLHGNGEKGNNSTDPAVLNQSISLITKHGPPKFVKNGHKFPFILISPQLKSNYGTWPTWYIDEVVEHVKTYLRIDEARIYVTGLSLGGGGAWVYAENFSSKIAALAPVCGGSNWPGNACRLVQNGLPVWAFHGDKDTVVPLSKSSDMVNAINACVPGPVPPALLTVYAGVAHNAWDYAYRTDNSLHTPNVYEWMMAQRNTTNGTNTLPIANAGNDVSISGTQVTLNGSGTDANGTISSYSWKQIEGPSTATLSNASSSSCQVSGLVSGTYVFRLTVTDNHNGTDSDYVKVQVNASSTNQAPIVNAGPDKTVTGTSVTLTGTATDPDGSITAYEWKKISGPPAWLNDSKTASVTAINLTPGTYTFRLTATDNKGATGSDDAVVVIKESTTQNNPPTANAGPDKTVTLPENSVTLTGTGTDTDGTITSYEWKKISGPPAWLNNSKTASVTAINLTPGTYTFRLTVTDNRGATGTDDAIVVIKESTSTNKPPVANAGHDRTITLPENQVTLTGSGTDPDGTITSYDWKKISGPPAWLNNPNTASVTAINLTAGTYTFRLTVTDNRGATSYDDAILTVANTATNRAPYANAGPDITITLPTNSITLKGTGLDLDGSITAYQWTKVSGPQATMTNTQSTTMTASNLVAGTYHFRLTVTDNSGATGYDNIYVTVNGQIVTNRTVSLYAEDATGTNDELSFSASSRFDLSQPCDCNVSIFNETGKQIYSGAWSPEMYHDVFSEKGLYIYHIQDRAGQRASGKLFIVK